MKKLLLSVAAITAMSTFAVAGGDIAPVEEVVVEEPAVGGFYLGGAYGRIGVDVTDATAPIDDSATINSFMLQVGYAINEYFAVEGRAWFGGSDTITDSATPATSYSVDADAWGIYVKPTYPVTDAFDVYALLGYGDANVNISPVGLSGDTEGFQWGLGLSYDVWENIAVFADYVSLYNDNVGTTDINADAWNFGVTYKF